MKTNLEKLKPFKISIINFSGKEIVLRDHEKRELVGDIIKEEREAIEKDVKELWAKPTDIREFKIELDKLLSNSRQTYKNSKMGSNGVKPTDVAGTDDKCVCGCSDVLVDEVDGVFTQRCRNCKKFKGIKESEGKKGECANK